MTVSRNGVTAWKPNRRTQVVFATLFVMLRSAYFGFLRLTGKPIPWTFVALMYHSVRPEDGPRFSRQMDFLRRRTQVVGADFPGSAARPAGRYVALTFDDGFESFQRQVVPVLRTKDLPATVFVVTKDLGRRPGWISSAGRREEGERLLSEEELRALAAEGVATVGSHTVSHVRLLSDALSEGEIRSELEDSKVFLESRLGRPITLFALPFGAADEGVLRLADEVGYQRVFLSVPLGSWTNIQGRIAGRIGVSPSESLFSFRLKALGGYQFLPLAIAAKARLLSLVRTILGHRRQRNRP